KSFYRREAPKCCGANLSYAAWRAQFPRLAAASCLFRERLRQNPAAARGDDLLSQSRDLRMASASAARWPCPERVPPLSRIPEFSAIRFDSCFPAAANSIIAEGDCLCLTCRNATASLILPARNTWLTHKNRFSPWVGPAPGERFWGRTSYRDFMKNTRA